MSLSVLSQLSQQNNKLAMLWLRTRNPEGILMWHVLTSWLTIPAEKAFLFLGSYELLQSEGLHYRAVHEYGISWNIFEEIWCKCIYWHTVFNLPVNEILANPENNPHKVKSPKPLRVSEVSKTRCGVGHKVHFVSVILSVCFWNQFKLLLCSYVFSGLMLTLAQCYIWAVRCLFAMKRRILAGCPQLCGCTVWRCPCLSGWIQ